MATDQRLERCTSVVPEVTPDELVRIRQGRQAVVILDVRDEGEAASVGRISGSIPAPGGAVSGGIERLIPDKETPIVAYCGDGGNSPRVAAAMNRLGYRDVASLSGGFRRWAGLGLAVEAPGDLSRADGLRYGRHLGIPTVGPRGQRRLLDARVLMIGAGGIGSPAALYLAAAGIGSLGILDHDDVEESNLQRQVLHRADRIGMSKARSARETLLALNPGIQVEAIECRLDRGNARALFADYDLVVDGSDNFPTRYLASDASILTGTPVIHGSAALFEGHVTVLNPPHGPCYRCLFPEPPPGSSPTCGQPGVLGAVPGVIGTLVAVECIKLILGLEESLVGTLLVYDALKSRFYRLEARRDPSCPFCAGETPFPGPARMAMRDVLDVNALNPSPGQREGTADSTFPVAWAGA